MVIDMGRSVYLARHGADGVVDITPFAGMNDVVKRFTPKSAGRRNSYSQLLF
jgi:hypothetical protein